MHAESWTDTCCHNHHMGWELLQATAALALGGFGALWLRAEIKSRSAEGRARAARARL